MAKHALRRLGATAHGSGGSQGGADLAKELCAVLITSEFVIASPFESAGNCAVNSLN
jgi:hypothetical protein